MASDYKWVLKEYPQIITKEQLYRICHVSKETARHYLENGLIPCMTNGKKTRKYRIKTEDVVRFLEEREGSVIDCSAPAGWYQRHSGIYAKRMSPATKDLLLATILQILEGYPDVLTVQQIAEITGYSKSTITGWCKRKCLQHFIVKNTLRIPQQSFIAYFTSDHYRDIQMKSRKHIMLLAKIREETGEVDDPKPKPVQHAARPCTDDGADDAGCLY